ncbi:MAG TPA: hypothetical protein VMW67_03765 [Desulfobacteria bacterium]|nr:hypothetical protein [Desulfobacteria bacterium]
MFSRGKGVKIAIDTAWKNRGSIQSVPVIASNISGVGEIARSGGLVCENEEELVQHITRILEDDALATDSRE